MAVNPWLAVSAALVALLGIFHSVAGERFIVARLLRRENLPRLFGGDGFTKATLRYAWHLTTVLALAVAALLAWAAAGPLTADRREVATVLVWALAVGGLLGAWSTRGRHLSWIVLLLAAFLAWVGAFVRVGQT